jgi:hypothetical protein
MEGETMEAIRGYNRRKWDVRWECGEYIVRLRGQKKVKFIAHSEWALRIGFGNCERPKAGPWRTRVLQKRRKR